MANIEISQEHGRRYRILLNGMDISDDVYAGSLAFVSVGDDPKWAEIGVSMTFALSSFKVEDPWPPDHLARLSDEAKNLATPRRLCDPADD